jgi:hypothetical protein
MHSQGQRAATFAAVLLAVVMAPHLSQAEKPAPAAPAAARPDPAEVAQWRKNLLEWRRWFLSEKLDPERSPALARQNIAAIDDAAAVPAIVAVLKAEKNPQLRRVLVQPLLNLGGKDALKLLVQLSVEDENPLLREEACAGLRDRPELAEHLDQYLEYLKKKRQGVNVRYATEAAEALMLVGLTAPRAEGELPNEKLVRGLTGALDTAPVVDDALKRDWIPDPRDSKARQKRRSPLAGRVPVVETPNPVVLAALVEHTGEDFQYDKAAWISWLEKRLSE